MKDEILPLMSGLDLELVGGLWERGWTLHDIDVVGDNKDLFELTKRLKKNNIYFLIRPCLLKYRLKLPS